MVLSDSQGHGVSQTEGYTGITEATSLSQDHGCENDVFPHAPCVLSAVFFALLRPSAPMSSSFLVCFTEILSLVLFPGICASASASLVSESF